MEEKEKSFNTRVAITIDDQIDALENSWRQMMRISLSSGFNWHLIQECAEIFSFEEWNDYTNKTYMIWQKLVELRNEQHSKTNTTN
jgi:hypothetical protein